MKRKVFRFYAILFITLLFSGVSVQAQRPDASRFAQRGEYAVGTQDFTIEDPERPLRVTVWYPADNQEDVDELALYREGLFATSGQAIRNAEIFQQDTPYPLILYSHGSSALRLLSLFFTEHIASYGFVVMAVDHPGNTILDLVLRATQFPEALVTNFATRPQDILRVIDFAGTLNTSDGTLAGMIDMEQIAVTGYSFGGYTALANAGARIHAEEFASWCEHNQNTILASDGELVQAEDAGQRSIADNVCFILDRMDTIAEIRGYETVPTGLWEATTDARIDAVVVFAPWNMPIFGDSGLTEVEIPALFIVGSQDGTTIPERDAYRAYEQISSEQKSMFVLENANHYIFVDECTPLFTQFGFYDSCSDKVWDMQRAHDLTNHLATAFLLSIFMDNEEAQQALIPESVSFPGTQYQTSIK